MILVENLTVKYNASEEGCALRDISFSLRNGERVALIGANGPAAQILSNAQMLDKCGLEPPLSMVSLNL